MFFILVSFLPRKVSPVKNSILLVLFSFVVAYMLYKFYMILFPCGSLLVSYSSGMMVVFCYCSMMVDFDSKNNSYSSAFLLFCFSAFLLFCEGISPYSPYSASSLVFISFPFSVGAMCVVVLAMFCINASMFNPKKSLSLSY